MDKQTYTENYKSIENILLNLYIKGCIESNSEIMKPAFSEKATMYSIDENGNISGGLVSETLFPGIDSFSQSVNPRAVVSYINIIGTAASARVDADNIGGHGFTDYFNLLKINGEWKIISKVFQGHY